MEHRKLCGLITLSGLRFRDWSGLILFGDMECAVEGIAQQDAPFFKGTVFKRKTMENRGRRPALVPQRCQALLAFQ